jgi:hypothetical protein
MQGYHKEGYKVLLFYHNMLQADLKVVELDRLQEEHMDQLADTLIEAPYKYKVEQGKSSN